MEETLAAKNKYTEEFKKKVAEAASEEGSTLKSVGDEFGINPTLVRNWKLKYTSPRVPNEIQEKNTDSEATPILLLVDIYQQIEDEGVDEFDDLDNSAQASLIKNVAKNIGEQADKLFEANPEVFLLGLENNKINFVSVGEIENISSNDVKKYFDDGFVQFSVSYLYENDWLESLSEVSGNLDCLISAIGKHPKFEGIIKQGYAFGELEEGALAGDDEDEFANNKIWVQQYKRYLG